MFEDETSSKIEHINLTTTFDLSNVTPDRLLYFAAKDRLITWRASVGIKKLTEAEAIEKLIVAP